VDKIIAPVRSTNIKYFVGFMTTSYCYFQPIDIYINRLKYHLIGYNMHPGICQGLF